MDNLSWQKIQEFVNKLTVCLSVNSKIDIISLYKDDYLITKFLRYTYSPFIKFHLSSETIKNNDSLEPELLYTDLFELLDDLSNRTIVGHNAIKYVKGYVSCIADWQKDLFYCVLDKNLKARVGVDLINRAIPRCIPVFKVALANSYDDQKLKINFLEQTWFISQKLDGVRCLAIIDKHGECQLYSRRGKKFNILDVIKQDIESLGLSNIVLDGEVFIGMGGSDDFQSIMKEITKKNHTIENPQYRIFDCLSTQEFYYQTSTRVLSARLNSCPTINSSHVSLLPQSKINSDEHFQQFLELSVSNNWEGLMLRKDEVYKGKRTNDMLKVKKFIDAEYIVKDVQTSIQRIIIDGSEVEKEVLSSVTILHKDCEVSVGSGFSHEERLEYGSRPNSLLGKTITVQFFKETLNQNGQYSLRFPIVKFIYDDQRVL